MGPLVPKHAKVLPTYLWGCSSFTCSALLVTHSIPMLPPPQPQSLSIPHISGICFQDSAFPATRRIGISVTVSHCPPVTLPFSLLKSDCNDNNRCMV